MRAGGFRDRVTLQSRVTTTNGYGETVPTWTNVGPGMADIQATAGRSNGGDVNGKTASHKVILRSRHTASVSMRLLWGDRVLTIISAEPFPKSTDQLLLCEEHRGTLA